MLGWLKRVLAPPTFPGDHEKTRQAALLHATLLVALCVTTIYTLSTLLAHAQPLRYFVIGSIAGILWLVLLLLVQRGHLSYIALTFTTLNWLLFTSIALLGNGIHSPAIAVYIMIVVIAVLLLGNRVGIVFTGLSLFAMLGMVVAENYGLLPPPYLLSSDASRVVVLATAVAGTTSVLLLVNRSLRQAAQEQRQAVQALHSLLNAMPDAILRFNREMVWTGYIPSKGIKTILPPEKFLGEKIADTLPEDLAQRLDACAKRALETGEVQTLEYALDDNFFEARVVSGEDGGLIAVVRDITERVQAQSEREELFATIERANAQLLTAARVSKTCAGIFDRATLIEQAVNLIQQGLDVYYVGLFLVDKERRYAVLHGGSGEVGRQMVEANHRLPLDGKSMVAWCIQHNRARIAQQATLDRVWLQNPYLPETRSELALPLTSRDQVIGALTVQSAKENAFTRNDIAVLQTMAEQLAVSIDNANLFTQLQHELTERKKAEAALRNSEEKLQKIFRTSPVAISIRDLEGRYLNINDGFTALTGYTAEDVIGKTIEEIGHAVSTEAWKEITQRLQEDGAIKDTIVEVRRKDGEHIFLLVNSELTTLDGEERIITSSMDITARKRSEEALRASEEKFAKAFHASPSAAFIQRASDHSYVEVNNAFCRLIGYTQDEIRSSTALQKSIFRAGRMPEDIIEGLQQFGQIHDVEIEFITKSGETGIGLFSADQIVVNGELCYLVLIQDITQQKRAAAERETLIQELSAKNAELERFTYTVSHDLKSPLVTIRGFLGYLEDDAHSGNMERLHSDIERIGKAVERMQRLLDDLLKLSRIGRLINPPGRIPFGELAREAVSLVEGQLTAAQAEVQIDPDMPEVWGDRVRLLEVLQNLLDNAVKFRKPQERPSIHIGYQIQNEERVFFVRDNGIGIEPQYHEKIFGLFNKLDQNTEGTGVGLALVRRIIEVHNGKIWVESDGAGRGSTFYFTLPAPKASGGKYDQ